MPRSRSHRSQRHSVAMSGRSRGFRSGICRDSPEGQTTIRKGILHASPAPSVSHHYFHDDAAGHVRCVLASDLRLELLDALAAIPCRPAILDAELVLPSASGVPVF